MTIPLGKRGREGGSTLGEIACAITPSSIQKKRKRDENFVTGIKREGKH